MNAVFSLELADDRPEGAVRLTGSTNGFVFLQILVEARRDSSVEFRTTELVNGPTRFTTLDNEVSLAYTNYLQNSGVRSGANTLAVNAVGDTDLIDRIVVRSDSGILRLPIGPAELVITVSPPADVLFPVGEPVTFPVSLSTNGWPVTDVELSARVIEGDTDVSVGQHAFAVVGESPTTTSMTVTLNSNGEATIALIARGSNGMGRGLLTIRNE